MSPERSTRPCWSIRNVTWTGFGALRGRLAARHSTSGSPIQDVDVRLVHATKASLQIELRFTSDRASTDKSSRRMIATSRVRMMTTL